MTNDADSSIALASVSAPLLLAALNLLFPQAFLLVCAALSFSKSLVFPFHSHPTSGASSTHNPSVQLSLSRSPAVQNVYVNINRIMSVGNRLLESGHYASQQIKQISGQLEKEWKAFAAALDERSTLLEMSASFHQKCDQVSQKQIR